MNFTAGGSKTQVLEADFSDGFLNAKVLNNGKKARGVLRVNPNQSPQDVSTYGSDQKIKLPPGRYRVNIELADSADFASIKSLLWVEAGKTANAEGRFRTGRLSVNLIQNRKSMDGTVYIIRQGAADYFNYVSVKDEAVLSPGKYRLAIESPHLGPLKKVERENIVIEAGRRTKVKVDVTPAILTVEVLGNKERVVAEFLVRHVGGGDVVGRPDRSGQVRLWPGRYEVVVKLPSGEELIDGPVRVALGERVTRRIQLKRVKLTVSAKKGDSMVSDAKVLIFRSGATVAFIHAEAMKAIELAPGKYDVKVTSGGKEAWKTGVSIKDDQTIQVSFEAEEPRNEAERKTEPKT